MPIVEVPVIRLVAMFKLLDAVPVQLSPHTEVVPSDFNICPFVPDCPAISKLP